VTNDAPAIGFAACACACAIGADEKRSLRSGLLCGVFMALAVWSKQTLAGVLPAILLYVVLTRDLRWALRFALTSCCVLAAISMIILIGFGPGAIVFN